MTDKEIINKILESFDFVTEYGATACEDTKDFSGYITIDDNIKNVKITD